MTIALGFLCQDGLVIGADTEITNASLKLQGSKVRIINQHESPKLAVTGAGDVDYLEYAFQQLDKTVKNGMTQDDVEAAVVSVVDDLYRKHIYCNPAYAGPSDPTTTDLLVGTWTSPDEWRLLRSSLTAVMRVRQFHLAGSGLELGRYVADRIFPTRHQINLPLGVLAATSILLNAKRYVQGCGGSSHLVALVEDGQFIFVDTSKIESDIQEIDRYGTQLLRVVLTGTPDQVTNVLNSISGPLREIVLAGSIIQQTKRIQDA